MKISAPHPRHPSMRPKGAKFKPEMAQATKTASAGGLLASATRGASATAKGASSKFVKVKGC